MRVFKKILVGAVCGMAGLALAPASAYAAPGTVSQAPATFTPHLPTSSSTTMQIRQLVPCGSTMFAVGSFTTIIQGGTTYTRNNAFSFNATNGAVTSWNPNVNGTVNSIGVSANCSTAYLGGQFTSVNGTAVKNIASVNTSTAAVSTAFTSKASGQVEAMLVVNGHLLVGGYFTSINGATQNYLISLNPTTGKTDNYANLNIAGNISFTYLGVPFRSPPGTPPSQQNSAPAPSRVYNFSLSPDGTRLLVMGDFTSVSGQGRQQIFMVDLGASAATLDSWNSPEFSTHCAGFDPFYLQAAAWSPDESTVYVATTGLNPTTDPGPGRPGDPNAIPAGLCDATAAFSSASVSTLTHNWINYAGCDSMFAVAADSNNVYIAGHERWVNQTTGCNYQDAGAVSRPGLGDLSPTTGLATSWNPTRDRGEGADDAIVTSAGLWVASDNEAGSNRCGGVANLAGICFLPY